MRHSTQYFKGDDYDVVVETTIRKIYKHHDYDRYSDGPYIDGVVALLDEESGIEIIL